MTAVASPKIIELRALLEARFPARIGEAGARVARETGLASLDAELGGGLPRGALVEVVRPRPGAGGATFIHCLLSEAARRGGRLALVDAHGRFDFEGLMPAILRSLLWVRAADASASVRAADLLLRDGSFPIVALDLADAPPGELNGLPASTWHRLAQAARQGDVGAVVLTPAPMVSAAAIRVELDGRPNLDAFARRRGELGAALPWRRVRQRPALVAHAG